MKVKIYLSNLAKYTEGNENGEWLQLPMESDRLDSIYNAIVGNGQESIILDYDAPFEISISEWENVFDLNDFLQDINENEVDDLTARIIFKIADSKEEAMEKLERGCYTVIDVDDVSQEWNCTLNPEELYGMVLNEVGYNNLFEEPIPDDMIDYIDFEQVWTALSINNGWQDVTIDNKTYLVTTRF